ncbi:hypothetical protein BJ875DRAFT_222196 [Amylocarpus encephaloides]|uniref:MYND-type zinc finger protein samB n=1 Tax=Amylocarpus encephaloides TaxID=45428 RepID=A0A9P7YP19_9HELO|nr:hypothetical protein BJ875DRAFT_222196 [Amylocarpus encephaloides]
MASPKSDAPSPPSLHENEDLCKTILCTVISTAGLMIRKSKILNAGSGLFATNDLDEGQLVYQSLPFLFSVGDDDGVCIKNVCDYCYASSLDRVHVDGHFYGEKDRKPALNLCAGCKSCSYCSKACQERAWKQWHKAECKVLKHAQPLRASLRLLYRLLMLQKSDRLSTAHLHALTLMKFNEAEYKTADCSNLENIIDSVKVATGTTLSSREILVLLYKIVTNGFSIVQADYSGGMGSLGGCVDLTGAVLRHSCTPNAFYFFEGRELQVRTLRVIPAGEEISISYVNINSSYLQRSGVLWNVYHVACACLKCQGQLKQLSQWDAESPGGDLSFLRNLTQAEIALSNIFLNKVAGLAMTKNKNPEDKINHPEDKIDNPEDKIDSPKDKIDSPEDKIDNPEAQIENLTMTVFPNGDWPDDLAPLPALRTKCALLYSKQGEQQKALRLILKSCTTLGRGDGTEYLAALLIVLKCLAPFMYAGTRPKDLPKDFPILKEVKDVYTGYSYTSVRFATKLFGDDNRYARALGGQHMDHLSANGSPRVHSGSFQKKFRLAQGKLLAWAGIEDFKKMVLHAVAE